MPPSVSASKVLSRSSYGLSFGSKPIVSAQQRPEAKLPVFLCFVTYPDTSVREQELANLPTRSFNVKIYLWEITTCWNVGGRAWSSFEEKPAFRNIRSNSENV